MLLTRIVLVLALSSWWLGSPVEAAKRAALVIGNGTYVHAPRLSAPQGSARSMADALRKLGFDSVDLVENADRGQLERSVNEFKNALGGADIALVYFSGYAGAPEAAGTNYLVPVDAKLSFPWDLETEAVSLQSVRSAIGPATRLRMIILDTGWDPPFAGLKTQDHRGLAAADEAAAGELIAFASRAGTTAGSIDASTTPYTLSFLKNLSLPGLEIRQILARVRDDVSDLTDHRQEPSNYANLSLEPIYLNRPAGNPTQSSNVGQGTSQYSAPANRPTSASAESVWNTIKDTTSVAVLDAFSSEFSDSVFARLARARADELRQERRGSGEPSKAGHSSPAPVARYDKPGPVTTDVAAPAPAVAMNDKLDAKGPAKKETPAAARPPGDPLGLIGTWRCYSKTTYRTKEDPATKVSNVSGDLDVERFDGKYYWATSVATQDGTTVHSKSKYWEEDGRVYRIVYWTSNVGARKYINRTAAVQLRGTKLSIAFRIGDSDLSASISSSCTKSGN